MIARVLERTGSTVQVQGAMYKAVAQSVLLYGSESWVVTGEMLKVLTEFHHRASRRITGMTAKRGADGWWEYPAVEEVMESAGIHPIGLYIKRRQKTISESVAFRPVYALCTEVEKTPGTIQIVRWSAPCAALRRRGRQRLRWGYGGRRRGAPGAPRPVPPGGAGGWRWWYQDAVNDPEE